MNESDQLGFKSLKWDLVNRINDRLMINSPELAEIIWNRISPFLQDLEVVVDSLQQGSSNNNNSTQDGKRRIVSYTTLLLHFADTES